MTLTAAWAGGPTSQYTVTYNYAENGGSVATMESARVAPGAPVNLASVAGKVDWVFLGWNTNKDATTVLSSLLMPTQDVTLYAIYSRTLTVALRDLSGTAAASRSVSTTIYNKATSGSVTLPVVNAYTGWTTRGWASATTPGAVIVATSGAYTVTRDVTLYGVYQRSISATFNSGGGTPTPTTLSGTSFTNSYAIASPSPVIFTLPPAPSRAGYAFAGWVSTGAPYPAGASVSLTVTTAFTAVWI